MSDLRLTDLGPDDHIGTGYVTMADVMAKCQAATHTFTVPLRAVFANLDRGLSDLDDEYKNTGNVDIAIVLKPRAEAQKGFFTALSRTFDANDDGVLDRGEVAVMLATLRVPEDADASMVKLDADADDKMDKAEVAAMLEKGDFQDSEAATQMLHVYLRQAGRRRRRWCKRAARKRRRRWWATWSRPTCGSSPRCRRRSTTMSDARRASLQHSAAERARRRMRRRCRRWCSSARAHTTFDPV